MTQSDDARRVNQAPREPISPLIAALRRINATPDLDTGLGEVVASARALTGACYGVIAIPASKAPAFKPAKALREAIR